MKNKHNNLSSKNKGRQRYSDTNLIVKDKQECKPKRRGAHRCSDTSFVLKDQKERKQKGRENYRSSESCIPCESRNSFSNPRHSIGMYIPLHSI